MTDGPLGFEPESEEEREARRARLAHRRDPDLDEPAPRGGTPTPPIRAKLPGGASRYGWFIGVVGVLVITLITLNTFRSDGPGSTGLSADAVAPAFAAPLALSALEGDVNVATKTGQGDAGGVAACSIRRPDVLNLCALTERGPVVLAFFATRGAECIRQLDLLDDLARTSPGIGFAAVSIKGDRGDLRELIKERRWTFPVGYDADGILANLYGVAVCPQISFLRKGGRVVSTSIGELDRPGLEQRLRELRR